RRARSSLRARLPTSSAASSRAAWSRSRSTEWPTMRSTAFAGSKGSPPLRSRSASRLRFSWFSRGPSWSSPRRSSAIWTGARSGGCPGASRRSRTPTWRSWEKNEHAPAGGCCLVSAVQDDPALAVRRVRQRPLPAVLRHHGVLRLPRRREPEDAHLRVARGRRDGHVVVRQHLGRLGHAARALVGDARAPRRRAAPLLARHVPIDAGPRDR